MRALVGCLISKGFRSWGTHAVWGAYHMYFHEGSAIAGGRHPARRRRRIFTLWESLRGCAAMTTAACFRPGHTQRPSRQALPAAVGAAIRPSTPPTRTNPIQGIWFNVHLALRQSVPTLKLSTVHLSQHPVWEVLSLNTSPLAAVHTGTERRAEAVMIGLVSRRVHFHSLTFTFRHLRL